MDIEVFIQAVAFGLAISGFALVVSSWLKRDKRAEDWAMALGATLAMLGAIGLILATMGVNQFQSDDAGFIVIGCGVGGVVVFTMGYVIDRIRGRQIKDHQDYMESNLGRK